MILLAAGGTAVLVVGVIVLAQWLVSHASDADARAIARARTDGVASGVRLVDGRLAVTEGSSDFLDTTAWVFDGQGRLIDGTVPVSVRATATRLAQARRTRYVVHGDRLLYCRSFTVGSAPASVIATVELEPYEASERRLLETTLLLGILTVAIAAAVAGFVAKRSLAAVHHMTAQADQWREHDLSRRFDLGPGRDEITHLGHTLDRMLDRIAEALSSERRITDEIAHELRTPLTIIRAEAQLSLRHADGAAAKSLTRVIEAVDRMDQAIRTVLDAARARNSGSNECDLVAAVSSLLLPDEELTVPDDARQVAAADNVVHAILGPLLDNARRHRAARVWAAIELADASAIAHVYDDGPGFTTDAVDQAFEPGWSTSDGHGLGLTLARRLATSHGLTVGAMAGPPGHVYVSFPLRRLT